MRQILMMALVLALAGIAAVPLAAQISGGGMGNGGIGSGGMGGDADGSGRGGGRHHGGDAGESGGATRHARSDSTATPPKPGEVVKKGRLNLPEGLGGDKVHTAYLEVGPR